MRCRYVSYISTTRIERLRAALGRADSFAPAAGFSPLLRRTRVPDRQNRRPVTGFNAVRSGTAFAFAWLRTQIMTYRTSIATLQTPWGCKWSQLGQSVREVPEIN